MHDIGQHMSATMYALYYKKSVYFATFSSTFLYYKNMYVVQTISRNKSFTLLYFKKNMYSVAH
jgi:hypothetical protein